MQHLVTRNTRVLIAELTIRRTCRIDESKMEIGEMNFANRLSYP